MRLCKRPHVVPHATRECIPRLRLKRRQHERRRRRRLRVPRAQRRDVRMRRRPRPSTTIARKSPTHLAHRRSHVVLAHGRRELERSTAVKRSQRIRAARELIPRPPSSRRSHARLRGAIAPFNRIRPVARVGVGDGDAWRRRERRCESIGVADIHRSNVNSRTLRRSWLTRRRARTRRRR